MGFVKSDLEDLVGQDIGFMFKTGYDADDYDEWDSVTLFKVTETVIVVQDEESIYEGEPGEREVVGTKAIRYMIPLDRLLQVYFNPEDD